MRTRLLLAILASMAFLPSKAQLYSPASHLNYPLPSDQKWQFSHYASLSAGYTFYGSRSSLFPGGASFISTPVSLQLSHPLNKNLYAFTGISVAPTFFSFNRLYTQPINNSSYPGSYLSRPYGVGLNSRVEMGLMYVNDAKTFSISGSFGVEKGTYPVYPSNRVNTKKQ
jgi:hypothetical protein